jgi:RNase P subunit RPR2
MEDSRKDVTWSPRVSKGKLKRLYESTCRGIWDEELIDDVGMTLYLRCRDIVNIHQAQTERKLTCPRCQRVGTNTVITREQNREVPMECHVCGWAMTWPEQGEC